MAVGSTEKKHSPLSLLPPVQNSSRRRSRLRQACRYSGMDGTSSATSRCRGATRPTPGQMLRACPCVGVLVPLTRRRLPEEAGVGTENRAGDWRSIAWSLERTYPEEFARPEVQFQINNTYAPSVTTNQNVVILAPERAKAMADRSQILEAQVDKLLEEPSKSGTAGEGDSSHAQPGRSQVGGRKTCTI